MPARFHLVTINSTVPDQAAAFWCEAIGLHETGREDVDRWIVLSDASGIERVGIQKGVVRAGGVHLDLECTRVEFEVEVARLCALGAAVLQATRSEAYGLIANLADPDGNPFDLCAYD